MKEADPVPVFKARLATFKKKNLNQPGNYLELSDQFFQRIHNGNRSQYIENLVANPDVARRRKINIVIKFV